MTLILFPHILKECSEIVATFKLQRYVNVITFVLFSFLLISCLFAFVSGGGFCQATSWLEFLVEQGFWDTLA
ncbi:hypothetical protein CROQUDRAFT_655252 [Cronartium quercuum f. sp. fusiforme G11]|uniref:Uncharacterized protein n=1 Tax=Cronartium quercuum f. sp. fusiforme G11 TaxID=708437 RepID=A0A9P6NR88_9BASI|nr:hypothetical protein CROQUDRAFT_655252 [Cronartium quercuum f. sp. fusiforme G11]